VVCMCGVCVCGVCVCVVCVCLWCGVRVWYVWWFFLFFYFIKHAPLHCVILHAMLSLISLLFVL